MPTRAPLACANRRCPNVQPCPDHPASWSQGMPGYRQEPGWQGTRARVLAEASWRCGLNFAGCTGHANEVHHAPGRLVAACHQCHAIVTSQQAAAARAR